MKMKIRVLGCGSSSGVPSIEGGFGACDPNNPKNYRSRSSIIVNIDDFIIVIDTSPDFKPQVLQAKLKRIDAIFYTHQHSDHVAGAFDIRAFNRLAKNTINYYTNQETFDNLQNYAKFVFEIHSTLPTNFYKSYLTHHIIANNSSFSVNNNKIKVMALTHNHGTTTVLGYIFNKRFAYITDFSSLNEETISHYKNLDLLIISACTTHDNPNHLRYDKVINLITTQLKPKQAFLTHMSESIDYETTTQELRSNGINNVSLCYDGLELEV